jgi:hypothetical protein
MATKIRAHNLHTDVKAILNSKADISALAGKADISATGSLQLADSRFITLGADEDFTITHDGTNNIINSVGSGDLFIQDAGVNKLALNDTGIIVYGTIQSTTSGTPTITSASNIIFNADSGNGIINFSGSKIINLGNPVDSQDAAPKSYVDSVNYKDSDVNTHLNTSTATAGEVLSWNGTDYNWVSQSGGGTTTFNTINVDSDIKMSDTGAILTISPSGQVRFEKKVEFHGWSAALFAMFAGGLINPVPIYSNTNRLLSADITIHIATYSVNSAMTGYDSDFTDSQIIQGHLMHNHTTATFTETSNVCTDPGVNLITLSTSISSSAVSLDFQMAQEKLTRYTVHSRSAMQLNV